MIPRTLNGWVTLAIGLAIAVMASYMGYLGAKGMAAPMWAVLVNAALAFLGLYLKGGGKEIGVKGAGLILLCVSLLLLSSCKLPPIATAYRGHAMLIATRDGAGETLAKIQRAKMIECEAKHNPLIAAGKTALIACLKAARKPVRAWVRIIKPAVTTVAAALWLALESAYAAGRKDLDKLGKAALIACSTLTAAEATILQYADKLGKLKTVILGALAGGKILVCP